MYEGKLVFAHCWESLCDIEACRPAQGSKLYILWGSTDSHKTFANPNMVRGWHLYEEFAQSMIAIARSLYADDLWGPT